VRDVLVGPRSAQVGRERNRGGFLVEERPQHVAEPPGVVGTYDGDQGEGNGVATQKREPGRDRCVAATTVGPPSVRIVDVRRAVERDEDGPASGRSQQPQSPRVEPGAVGVHAEAHARRTVEGGGAFLDVGDGIRDEVRMEQGLTAEEGNDQVVGVRGQGPIDGALHHLGRHGAGELASAVAVVAAQVAVVVDEEGQLHAT